MKTKFILLLIAMNSIGNIYIHAQQKKTTAPSAAPKANETNAAVTAINASKPKITFVGSPEKKDASGAVIKNAKVPKQPFKIYTNPPKELLTIEYASADFKNSDISITDSKGRPIKQVTLEGCLTKINLNTRKWENGYYFIVVTQHTTRETVMQKIVLNR